MAQKAIEKNIFGIDGSHTSEIVKTDDIESYIADIVYSNSLNSWITSPNGDLKVCKKDGTIEVYKRVVINNLV